MPSRAALRLLLAAMVVSTIAIVLPGTSAPAAAAPMCTSTWTGPAGGRWHDPANWSPAGTPRFSSNVCVLSTAGPAVGDALIHDLYVRRATITLGGTLTIRSSFDVGDGRLVGSGILNGYSGSLSGEALTGGVTVHATAGLNVSGARSMCGGQLAVCLEGASHINTSSLNLSDGDIGGDTTATPAVSAIAFLVSDGALSTHRVQVELSATSVRNSTTASAPASLVLSRWDQLGADGTLNGSLTAGLGGIVVSRPITAVGVQGDLSGARVTTPDGHFAASTLSRMDGDVVLDTDVTIAPAGGALHGNGLLSVYEPEADAVHVTITGSVALTNDLSVQNNAVLSITGAFTGNKEVWLAGTLTAGSFTLSSSYLDLYPGARLNTGTITFVGPSGGIEMIGPAVVSVSNGPLVIPDGQTVWGQQVCGAQIRTRWTLSPHSVLNPTLNPASAGCSGLYRTVGTTHVGGELRLISGDVGLGTQVVIVHAIAGLTGRFASLTGDVNVGPNHWAISYTPTQVIATLVSGNV